MPFADTGRPMVEHAGPRPKSHVSAPRRMWYRSLTAFEARTGSARFDVPALVPKTRPPSLRVRQPPAHEVMAPSARFDATTGAQTRGSVVRLHSHRVPPAVTHVRGAACTRPLVFRPRLPGSCGGAASIRRSPRHVERIAVPASAAARRDTETDGPACEHPRRTRVNGSHKPRPLP